MRAGVLGAGLGLALAVGVVGCGPDEGPQATGAAMAEAGSAPAEAGSNRAPRIDAIELRPARPAQGERVRALVSAADPDGDAFHLAYHWRIDGRTLEDAGAEIRLDRVRKGALVELTVEARDRHLSDEASVQVRVANRPPILHRMLVTPAAEVTTGSTVSVDVEAEDPDRDPLRLEYVWSVNGRRLEQEESFLSTAGMRRGDRVAVRVRAHDGDEWSAPMEGEIFEISNAPPRIGPAPVEVGASGRLRYRPDVHDPDGDRPLRFSLLEGPPGMTMDPADGELAWTPRGGQTGAFPVEIAVEDPYGGRATQRFELSVDPPEGSGAPPPAAGGR